MQLSKQQMLFCSVGLYGPSILRNIHTKYVPVPLVSEWTCDCMALVLATDAPNK